MTATDYLARMERAALDPEDELRRQPTPGKVSLTQRLTARSTPPMGSEGGVAQLRAEPGARATDDPFGLHLGSTPARGDELHFAPGRYDGGGASHLVAHELVQAKAASETGESTTAIHAAAAHGISGAGGALPFADQIQRSFGRHDIGNIRAHTGSSAHEGAAAMRAEAFATGDHVAFGATPSLHTTAHEAAHIVQQRAGVHLKGGVGEAGDEHERHADAVADRVVAGESAESLLDSYAGGGGSGSRPAIQRKPSDLKRDFGEHAQMAILKRLPNSGWNAYVVELEPYLKIEDRDTRKCRTVLGRLYPNAIGLVRERHGLAFTDEQHALALEINARLEQEKLELYGSQVGMMQPAHDLETREGIEPVIGDNGTYDAQHAPMDYPLFATPPSMNDVQQGSLGDCFLLAATAAVIDRDPDHFVLHMADNLNGTVTVKLYADVNRPIQVVIQKSVPGERFARNVLWVKLLEKAYAASGLNRRQGALTPVAYNDIEGGSTSTALTHLTGKPSGTLGVGRKRNHISSAALDAMEEELSVVRGQLNALQARDEEINVRIAQKQQQGGDVTLEEGELEETAKRVAVLIHDMAQMQSPIVEFAGRLSTMLVTQASFLQFIETHRDNQAVQNVLNSVVPENRRDGLFPGAIGTGLYGADEQLVFGAVKEGLDAGKPMTAGTKLSISDQDGQVENRGPSGEPKVKGLAGKHAYTVLDYRPRLELAEGQVTYLKLRNPWGNYGRAYQEELGRLKAVAIEGGTGTFWIELADFVANFTDVNWADRAPGAQDR